MDLEKENEQLRRQNEVLKEALNLLTKQLNFYRASYEKVMRDIQEIAK
jgi:hypothetical protein